MRHRYPFAAFAFGISFTFTVSAEEQRAPLSTFEDCDVCPELVVIPAGDFMMGSPSDEKGHYKDESPQHMASVAEFAIGKYEVTFTQYDAFVEGTGHKKPADEGWGRGERPVINVSLIDAAAYAEWLSERTGKRYRLPTAAEWEYAARAGTTTAYPWGDNFETNRANCSDCGTQWDGKQTAPVGSFTPNPWGLHDTVGNVWEWTCSIYEEQYTGEEQRCTSLEEGGYRSTRSGSWRQSLRKARSASQHKMQPGIGHGIQGFRLARDI